jgi:hypothetical protein
MLCYGISRTIVVLAYLKCCYSSNLVLTRRTLAGLLFNTPSLAHVSYPLYFVLGPYQLFQVPTADLHISLVLIQTLGELLRVHLAASWSPSIILLVASGRNAVVLLLLRSGLGGSATEESTDRVTDRRPDCNTATSSKSV